MRPSSKKSRRCSARDGSARSAEEGTMAVYKWQGVSPKGETLKGEMEATSREAVIIRLRTQRIKPEPARIKEKGKGLDYEINVSFGSPVKQRDVVILTRQ